MAGRLFSSTKWNRRGCNPGYAWQACEDFQVPDNSVWYGRDDDGSDIFCGKAWCDGEEVPAKVIPRRRECRVIDNGCERVVPNCRKVLICSRSGSNRCERRGDDCHRRRHHHCNDDSSSCESEVENTTTTKKSTCSNNESKILEKSSKSWSSSTTTVVKKGRKKRQSRGERCRYVRRTRMVPQVTVQPRVRYIPQVINERSVRYVQESYVTRVCEKRRCEPSCEPCEPRCESRCEPCCEPCEQRYEPCCEPREQRCEPCCEPCEQRCEPCCEPCEQRCEPCCEPCAQRCEPCEPCEPCNPCDPCGSNRRRRTVVFSAQSAGQKLLGRSRRC
ncbi:scavenger receptor class F member 2-like [Harmonia axyridis]|uniref:scavenger receptor class F member 2-like n=1 Tax=Harmonia axyridis TaxID=115357 RepID=UPI001E278040|nr:scavenger receptor class F member 2-like [Harmonia axyridis]